MPKPGKYNKPTWTQQYADVNRYDDSFVKRRVSFKPTKNGRRDQHRDWDTTIRQHLADEDIDMGSTSGPGRTFNSKKFYFNKNRGGNRSGSPVPNKGMRRKLYESPTSWYRVTLPFGNKYERSFVQKLLLEKLSPLPFMPVTWKINGTVVTFYIDDFKVAEKLHGLDRQLQCPDGFRMIIKVNSGSPHVEVNTELTEKMKLAMAKRYNSATKALDLTKFHADPDLLDYFCGLSKPIIFIAVVEIIAENIPELEALNLYDNKMQIVVQVKKLSHKMPNLKILHLGANKLREMSMLDAFVGLPIVDLVLDGNPLCEKYSDKETYIRTAPNLCVTGPPAQLLFCSEVRKRFPKVIKLDGMDLPPPISFDIQDEVHLPPAQQTFLCNQSGQEIVRKFLEQYFLIYDSDNRQPLLQAYHEGAVFSMTSAYPYGQNQKTSAWLNWYNTDNRNLLKVQDSERRAKLLKQGHVAIVSFLQEMPTSKHDIHNFSVDLVIFLPQMLVLTVSGMFKELKSGHKTPPIRHFFRTMVIVPAGAGFCIANEQLHISNATESQQKLAFKTPEPVVLPTAVLPTATVTSPVPDDNTKQQMVQALAQMSGMNLEWSQKCLAETNWDYQRATVVFTELHKQGTIPAEAFIK